MSFEQIEGSYQIIKAKYAAMLYESAMYTKDLTVFKKYLDVVWPKLDIWFQHDNKGDHSTLDMWWVTPGSRRMNGPFTPPQDLIRIMNKFFAAYYGTAFKEIFFDEGSIDTQQGISSYCWEFDH